MEEDIRVRVAHHYIKNTPVGELPDVLKDLRKLAGDEVVDAPATRAAVLDHHVHHCAVVTAGDLKLLVSQSARQDDIFIDPKHRKAFTVDPYTQTAELLDEVEVEVDETQVALQEKLDQYLTAHFIEEAQGRVYRGEAAYHIVISAHSINLRNFWTGEWVSQWTVTPSKLEGSVAFRAHYFEDGNLQMSQEKKVTVQLDSLDSAVASIISAESEIHGQLETVYEQLPQSCFKLMRRTMPVTQTRFSEIHRTKMLS
jgi:capping protein alpha